MVHFFGVLSPGYSGTTNGKEAPFKADFFHWAPGSDVARATQVAADKSPTSAETIDPQEDDEHQRFVRMCLPPNW